MPKIKINLGSGFRKLDGHINIDNREYVSPDMLVDLSYGIPFKDNSVDLV
jgi:predicted SAM-dependent methyltransferase